MFATVYPSGGTAVIWRSPAKTGTLRNGARRLRAKCEVCSRDDGGIGRHSRLLIGAAGLETACGMRSNSVNALLQSVPTPSQAICS